MTSRRLEQASRSFDVGADEGCGVENRTVHMRFRGEVHHCIESMPFEQLIHLGGIRNVALDEGISRIIRDFVEIAKIACIGEEIVIDGVRVLTLADEIANEARADETGSAGNQNLHCFLKMDAED